MSNEQKTSKLTLIPLILMIFTSVFGFANMPRAFLLMGYSAIPWYMISAILFFIPYAFMLAEYGAAFKEEKGGIYSWMEKTVSPKYAFVATFMWYASYIVWMVNICSSIWVPLSNAIFGSDRTSEWSFGFLNSTQLLGVLGVIWIIFITIVASKGLEKIKKVTSIAGTAVSLLNIVLLIGGITVLIANKGQAAEAITASAFYTSPNPAYSQFISVISFMVFAIFAFGGIEAVGGLVDQTENPEKTFPKGVAIAAIIISVGYCVGILMVGLFTNWNDVLSGKSVNMANVAYVVMNNLGYQIGIAFGASQSVALSIGAWIARFAGLSMFLALTGAFFTLAYSPLKQLIEGTPKKMWPGKMGEIEDGMPKKAMWIQCIIVAVIVALVSFGGEGAKEFFEKLVLMTNVAMTIPYLFISAAFIKFKNNESIEKPFEVYKSRSLATAMSIVVTAVIGFANFFTIIEPAVNGNIGNTVWMIAGPLVFIGAALLIFNNYEKKTK